MGRQRLKVNLEILQQLRGDGLGWRTIECYYYSKTQQEISFMTLKRRCLKAEPAVQEGNNSHQDGLPQ